MPRILCCVDGKFQWLEEAIRAFNNDHKNKTKIILGELFFKDFKDIESEIEINTKLLEEFAKYVSENPNFCEHFEYVEVVETFPTQEQAILTAGLFNKKHPYFWIDASNIGTVLIGGKLSRKPYYFVEIANQKLRMLYLNFLRDNEELCRNMVGTLVSIKR